MELGEDGVWETWEYFKNLYNIDIDQWVESMCVDNYFGGEPVSRLKEKWELESSRMLRMRLQERYGKER